HADGADVGGAGRVGPADAEPVAARNVGALLCVFPVVCGSGAGFLRLPERRDAAGSRIHLAISRSGGATSGVGSEALANACGGSSAAVGVVPDLLPIRHGEAVERRSEMAQP